MIVAPKLQKLVNALRIVGWMAVYIAIIGVLAILVTVATP